MVNHYFLKKIMFLSRKLIFESSKTGLKLGGLILFVFISASKSFAQTNISGIVNTYTAVTNVNQPVCAPCDLTCVNTITLTSAAGFVVGDKALIIQMKGAAINTTNTATGGTITAINNAGNYEFFQILSIVGNVITTKYPLTKTYTVADFVQVVKVPKYVGGANINATLTAKEWADADKTGGVLAIEADILTFNANINVDGKGFEGTVTAVNGSLDDCSLNPNNQMVLANTNTESVVKGNSIVVNNTASNKGRAPRGNGGGGGVAGDSGGGGGGNYGAGGEGGKRWCDVNGANAGGLGGKTLASYFPQDKVFLGGAGGPGYITNLNSSTAADGGGIVIIFANQIIGNGFAINANGFSPSAVNPVGAPDGGGGGGAGGVVVLKATTYTGSITVNTNGGDGQDLNTNTYHGPGGGGGGGALLFSQAILPTNITLNALGGIGGQHTDGTKNGSQNGSIGGSVSLYIPIENPNYTGNPDGDTVSVSCDLDDDNDGILDTVEAVQGGGDTDGDGIINSLDLDSDNDGISDLEESGNKAAIAADTNGDGIISNAESPAGTDGVPLVAQVTEGSNPANPKDTDADTKPDPYDLDSDNDSINDLTESGNTGLIDTNSDGVVDGTDADNDGIRDSADANDTTFGDPDLTDTPIDTDGDLIPDFRDLDSDNDGINDLSESGNTGLIDTNSDGVVDGTDADNDGIRDSADANDTTFGDPDLTDTPIDTDGDLIPDFRDLDSDNDGINDLSESGNTGLIDANSDGVIDGADADNDGIRDSADSNDTTFGDPDLTDTPRDTDGDSIPDFRDLDSDNDGINDTTESGLGLDADGNGIVDGPDADGDGIPDAADANDTTFGDPDVTDPPNVAVITGTPVSGTDSDGDGIIDSFDGLIGFGDTAPLSSYDYLLTNFRIYPNPSNTILNIEIDNNATIIVFDMIGKEIITRKISLGISQLDLSNYANGIYLLKVTTDNNQSKTMKIVKQ
jgi:hypothetical protein